MVESPLAVAKILKRGGCGETPGPRHPRQQAIDDDSKPDVPDAGRRLARRCQPQATFLPSKLEVDGARFNGERAKSTAGCRPFS